MAELVPPDVTWRPIAADGRSLRGTRELDDFWSSHQVQMPKLRMFHGNGNDVLVEAEYQHEENGSVRTVWLLYRFDNDRLIEAIAVAGQVTSLALLERLVEPEAELLDALDQATAAGLLSEAGPGEYVFTHALVRQAIYEELSATRRTRLHRRVGEALETVDGLEGGDGHAEALAHHFAAAAADGQCSKAAVYALAAGDSAITRLGYHEAAGYYELGAKALDAAGRQVDGQLCRLLLGLAEARSAAGDHRAAQSAQRRAADVAKQLGDTELLARQMVILGRLRRALGRSTDGRRSIDQARRLAHDAGDALTEFSALVDLGYVTNTSDLENGLALLERAERLYHRELAPRGSDASAELARDYQRLQGRLAIAEFDVWRFGAAARRMTACIPQMRKQGMGHDLPRMLGILGQLHTATGCFEQARDALWEGISMFGQRRDNIALRAYVRCLLGKLHLEMGRLDLAHAELARALTEVHKAGHAEYAMSVRLYLAELLLRVGQLRGASAHLDAVLGTAAGGGYPNLLPVVRSLAATIALASGDRVTALELSWVAVQALAPRRRLVLVRSEELFVRHARILRAVGDDAGAREWIAHALGVLREKERSIATPEVRHRFLTRVPLNRALLREAQALAV